MTAIPNVTEAAHVRHRRLAKVARRCVRLLGHDRHFFLEAQPNVRFTVPYPSAVQNPALDEFAWNGKVTAHGPHHNRWYCCPTNCINLWYAVSDVVVGNRLTIYPRLHGKRLPCDPRGRVLGGGYFQGALNFELRARDALVFHGDHLHSVQAELDRHGTRHVVSLRLTLDRPHYVGPSGLRFESTHALEPDVDPWSRLVEASREPLRRAAARLDGAWRHSRWNPRRGQGYFISTADRSLFDDVSCDFPSELDAAANVASEVDLSQLGAGQIRAISERRCIARLDDGSVVTFGRRCPHQGADLAGGYLRDSEVVCPWHNLPFNLRSGSHHSRRFGSRRRGVATGIARSAWSLAHSPR